MNIEEVKQIFSIIAMTLGLMKQTKDLLPDSENKDRVSKNIEQAEKQIQIAEIQIAQSMGHKICRNHWPSGIMISSDNKNWKCPVCGNEIKYIKTIHPGKGINSI